MKIKVEYYKKNGNKMFEETKAIRYIDPDIYPREKAYNRLAFELKCKYNAFLYKLNVNLHKAWNMIERVYLEVVK